MANSLLNGPEPGETPASANTQDTGVWMYRNGDAKLFPSPDAVPADAGWTDTPATASADEEPEKPKRRRQKTDDTVDGDGN